MVLLISFSVLFLLVVSFFYFILKNLARGFEETMNDGFENPF
jgi:hypothetical protein